MRIEKTLKDLVKWIGSGVLIIFILISVVFRSLFIPSDFGGVWFQAWFTGIGIVFLVMMIPEMTFWPRVIANVLVVPILIFINIGAMYFAPQALFPFGFIAIVICGVLYLWTKSKRILSMMLALVLVPLLIYSSYGINRMVYIYQLEHLRAEDVTSVTLVGLNVDDSSNGYVESGKRIEIGSTNDIRQIVSALNKTYPYSPNHEHIANPWRISLKQKNGYRFEFLIGHGNRVYQDTAWIESGVEVFQSSALFNTLENELRLPLW